MCRCEPLRTVTKCLNGTEGRTRTDTMSPSPDFESGASTNSATPAQAAIITKIIMRTRDFRKNIFIQNKKQRSLGIILINGS